MFVIFASFKQTDVNLETRERISKTLQKIGVSITITSLTDFIAFMIGYFTDFRSVQMFCIYAGSNLFFCCAYQIKRLIFKI